MCAYMCLCARSRAILRNLVTLRVLRFVRDSKECTSTKVRVSCTRAFVEIRINKIQINICNSQSYKQF